MQITNTFMAVLGSASEMLRRDILKDLGINPLDTTKSEGRLKGLDISGLCYVADKRAKENNIYPNGRPVEGPFIYYKFKQ